MEFLQQFSKFNYSHSCLAILLTYRLVAFNTLWIKLNLFHNHDLFYGFDLNLFYGFDPTFFMDLILNFFHGYDLELVMDLTLTFFMDLTFNPIPAGGGGQFDPPL